MDFKAQCGAVITTVTRKFQKSIEQRGVAGTARRCISRPLFHGICFLKQYTPSQVSLRRRERQFDSQFNVDTRQQKGFGWMAGLSGNNWKYGTGYEPVPIKVFTDVLRSLTIPFEDSAFVDFGSGKGRSLLLAAQFPFKEILGVEYSSQLNEVAVQNIRSYRNEKRKCKTIRSVCQDAAVAQIPLDSLVLFFNHPFDEHVFRPLIERIENSLVQTPRQCIVVYFDPQCADLFDDSPLFERTELDGEFDTSHIRGLRVWHNV
jgi:SAM-dependent methyltransferase